MARPELAVLLAYAKQSLTDDLVASDLPEATFFEGLLMNYFPRPIVERFGSLIPDHPLRRQLAATIIANEMLNSQGITFVSRLETETGAGSPQIVRAYRTARGIAGASDRWRDVEHLAGAIDADVVNQLLLGVDDLVENLTRWFIAHPSAEPIEERIDRYLAGFEELAAGIRSMGPKRWQNRHERTVARMTRLGVPEHVAAGHAYQAELIHAADIIDVATANGRPVEDVGRLFFRAGSVFHIDWLERQLESLSADTRWQRWAIIGLERELMTLRRLIVERMLATPTDVDSGAAFAAFASESEEEIARMNRLMKALRRDGVSDSAAIVVAIRQLEQLVR
jgi:glutamate dehydrogenase